MYYQTKRIRSALRRTRGRCATYIFHTPKLIAAILPERTSMLQHALQWRHLRSIWIGFALGWRCCACISTIGVALQLSEEGRHYICASSVVSRRCRSWAEAGKVAHCIGLSQQRKVVCLLTIRNSSCRPDRRSEVVSINRVATKIETEKSCS